MCFGLFAGSFLTVRRADGLMITGLKMIGCRRWPTKLCGMVVRIIRGWNRAGMCRSGRRCVWIVAALDTAAIVVNEV